VAIWTSQADSWSVDRLSVERAFI